MSDVPKRRVELCKDMEFALNRIAGNAVLLRDVLLKPYASLAPDALLGVPIDYDFRSQSDGLDRILDRIVEAGGSTRHLEGVHHTVEEFDHLVHTYGRGLLAGNTIAIWRSDVERLYAALGDALDAADSWREDWMPATSSELQSEPRSKPALAILEENEVVTIEVLAKALGLGYEQTRRRVADGEFDPVIGLGRRKLIRTALVKKALGLE